MDLRDKLYTILFVARPPAGSAFHIAPAAPLGQPVAGMALEAGPSNIAHGRKDKTDSRACDSCMCQDHDPDANYCKRCGHNLSH